ncbi:MAG: ABC transporter ATP-binding protein [Pirellulales bacterium]
MLTTQQRALLKRVGGVPQLIVADLVAIPVAITVPLLFVLCGSVTDVLASPEPDPARFGTWLPNIRQFIPADFSPLAEVIVLLGAALTILLFQVVCLYFFYYRVQATAVAFEAAVMHALRNHSRKLAAVRSLSGQQTALTDGLEYHLPRLRAGLSRWWRAFPRHVVQGIACAIPALLIAPVLALITLTAAVIIVVVYRIIDSRRRTALPVVRERATQRRNQVMSLCLKGPLLESVHNQADVQATFEEELASYRREAVRSLANSTWKTPLILALTGILGCLFVFLTAIQVLGEQGTLTVAGALTFVLCCVGTAGSVVRLQRSARELRNVTTAADDLERFLALPADSLPVIDAKRLPRVTSHVDLEHVTLQDSAGRKLLENVSAQFGPGQLYGLVASRRLQAQALMELLLGIGRPVSGRMLIDGLSVADIDPEQLRALGVWVSPDGPLVTGSIENNLLNDAARAVNADLLDALKASRALDAMQRLPEGTATVVTPEDDRFVADAPFRLGVARALLRQPSIIVMEEPESRVDTKTEQETIEAIRSVVRHNTITVLLPQRLTTLRQCDRILLIHEHQIADVGTHAELLQRSDLYRHINYVRFSPLRNVTV